MASFVEFEWRGCLEPVTDEQIELVETQLGVKLPEPFLECVRRCHGGVPGNFSFSYIDPDDGRLISDSLGYFFSFRKPLARETKLRLAWEPHAWTELGIDRSESILDYVADRPANLGKGLVPFSDNGSGDLICLDYRAGADNADPPVVLWRHEFVGNQPVVVLAENFAGFVAGLERYEPQDLLRTD